MAEIPDAISPHVDLQEKYNKVINKNISKFSIKDAINSLNDYSAKI